MKITRLSTFIVPPRWCFLKIETDAGIVGWGEPVVEGRAHSVAAVVEELADYLVGKDPRNIEDHWTVLYRGGFYRGGALHMSALAGIDQALWDIKGKHLGVPVSQLLGGNVRDKIRVYSWIGGDRPADTAAAALRAVERGFTAVKMNGTEELQYIDSHDKVDKCLENVAAVREAVGPNVGIGVDFHGRVHKPMAKVLIKELSPYKLMFIEEPVLSEHYEALKELAPLSATPIALGERLYSRWDFKRILSEGYVDIIQPDDGRGLRRGARPALPAGPHRAGRLPATRRGLLQRLHPGTEPGHPLQRQQRSARLRGQPRGLRLRPGHGDHPAGSGPGHRDRRGLRPGARGHRPPLAQPGLATRGRQFRGVVTWVTRVTRVTRPRRSYFARSKSKESLAECSTRSERLPSSVSRPSLRNPDRPVTATKWSLST
jgi:L-alanine-DL-glutamate epimerase-like enolase superfamily enzyme